MAKLFVLLSTLIHLAFCSNENWTRVEETRVTPTMPFSFKIALKPQNVEYLDKLFWQISDPESPLYGRFLNHDQIADLISLPETEIAKVESYLLNDPNPMCEVKVNRSLHRDYLHIQTCVGQAQIILPNLHLTIYKHHNTHILRSQTLTDQSENLTLLGVPHHLHAIISAIHQVTDLPYFSQRTTLPNPQNFWLKNTKELTINEIIDFYEIPRGGISDEVLDEQVGQVRQAVIEMDQTAFQGKALEEFQEKFHIRKEGISRVVGSGEENFAVSEGDMDVETITAMAQGVQTWSFVFDNTASYVDVVETLMKTEGAPKVVSVSWTSNESSLGKSGLQAANIQFMKLGLSGTSWFNGAGDFGPAIGGDCNFLSASYPGSSPYVVSVGGSRIETPNNLETAWFRSGGGFSANNPRPDFQKSFVDNYLKNAKMPPNPKGTRYQTEGRAYPDVSGFAALYPTVVIGQPGAVAAGTSAATPQWAGLITLINIKRFQKGLGPLGPLTQALYKLQKGVGTDVTHGRSYAIGYSCGDILPAYEAIEGWDPATGLGLPNYDILLEQLLQLGEKN